MNKETIFEGCEQILLFPCGPWIGTGSLLAILKNILELEYGPIGIKSLGSEPIGSNENRKEI
jgi:hypothetical protein